MTWYLCACLLCVCMRVVVCNGECSYEEQEQDACQIGDNQRNTVGTSMLQVGRRQSAADDPATQFVEMTSFSILDAATTVSWSLATDGSFKATETLRAEDVFQQSPTIQVGCKSCDCSFLGKEGYASPCDIEINSRAMVAKWLPADSSVLEVGARHGSNSCAISAKQGNSGKVIAMDADQDVWEVLEKNRVSHGCAFHIARGLLGRADGMIMQNEFGTFAAPKDAAVTQGNFNATVVVPHFTIEDLQQKFNLQIDVANFDCEGCFAIAMKDFPVLASQLKMIIVEVHDADEAAAVEKLREQGWELVDSHSRQRILKRQ